MMPNQTHPAPGNHGLILLNMARTHSEAYFKVSPRIRDYNKRAPGSAEKRPSAEAAANVTTLSTNEGENTSAVILQIFDPNKIIILT